MLYKMTEDYRACQLLLGHTKLESAVHYLGIEVEDTLSLSEQAEIRGLAPANSRDRRCRWPFSDIGKVGMWAARSVEAKASLTRGGVCARTTRHQHEGKGRLFARARSAAGAQNEHQRIAPRGEVRQIEMGENLVRQGMRARLHAIVFPARISLG